jgi:hypothetical protein
VKEKKLKDEVSHCLFESNPKDPISISEKGTRLVGYAIIPMEKYKKLQKARKLLESSIRLF